MSPANRGLPALPVERYRAIASVLLLGMLVISLLAPLGNTPAAPETFLPPTFDGRPLAISDAIFDYPAEVERQTLDPPSHAAVLRAQGLTAYFLRTIAADMLTEDSPPTSAHPQPSVAHPTRDGLLLGGPTRWDSLETFYKTIGDPWASNGLGVVEAMRAASSEGQEREAHQRQASLLFTEAVEGKADSAPYRYNWSLFQISLGHYGQAAAGLDLLIRRSPSGVPDEVRYYKGVALLRSGESQAAYDTWAPQTARSGGDWFDPASEGQADALAALGKGNDALNAYDQLLEVGGAINWDIYEKLIRLDLRLNGADALLVRLRDLADRYPNEARLRYDQGRLMLMLGRTAAATAAFSDAVKISGNDPALHTGLAMALLAGGNPRKALTEAESGLRAAGIGNVSAPDLSIVYTKLDSLDLYQRSVGQAVLTANLVRAAAQGRLGQADQVRYLASTAEAQGSGGDATKAAWYSYWAGLIYSVGGLQSEATARFSHSMTGTPAGPSRGALLLAQVSSLSPSDAPATNPPADLAGATAYYELARRLEAAGRIGDAGEYYAAAADWETGAQANLGQPPISPDGGERQVEFRAAYADYLRRTGAPADTTAVRYGQLLAVAPDVADAHTNRGLLFAASGQDARAQAEFEQAAAGAPNNPVALHNLGVTELRQGPTKLLDALDNLGAVSRAAGPVSLGWGVEPIAAPSTGILTAAAPLSFWTRLPAVVALILLLLHTLIPVRRASATDGATATPSESVLTRLGSRLPVRLPMPATLLTAIVVGGAAWAWALSGNDFAGALNLIPVTLVTALIAFGAQEGAQRLAARRERQRGSVETRLWPLGLLLSVIGAPFGVPYGWLLTTHPADAAPGALQQADGEDPDRPTVPAVAVATAPSGRTAGAPGRRKATADGALRVEPGRTAWRGWAAMGPAARVALAGLLANLLLAILFGALYFYLDNLAWRILLLGNVAVLAFTAVSDYPADGQPLWRRSPLLWLLIYASAAASLTAMLLGAV
ncbi:MAG: hypothetical protein ACR2M0_02805 [Chloroflexia bacterium]